jgi:hypothetical protein
MFSVSFAPASTSVQQPQAVQQRVPSSSTKGVPSNEDTVQLSSVTQQHLTNASASAPTTQPTITQIVKEAADGDITALAKLALIA